MAAMETPQDFYYCWYN
uniref:Uncharacterized protein n=1 Tax=Anguilla anguilla TaxID=7936 RepID=A0A0E9QMC6_ANGAN